MKGFFFCWYMILIEFAVVPLSTFSELWKTGSRYEAEKRLRGLLLWVVFGQRKLRIGSRCQFEGVTKIFLGEKVSIYDGVDMIAGTSGEISIASGTHIGKKTVINGQGKVFIGEGSAVSSHVNIYTVTNTVDNKVKVEKVIIGKNVLIGAGVVILPGVTIGDNAKVGAGAVVTKDVEARSVVGGVPAKKLC